MVWRAAPVANVPLHPQSPPKHPRSTRSTSCSRLGYLTPSSSRMKGIGRPQFGHSKMRIWAFMWQFCSYRFVFVKGSGLWAGDSKVEVPKATYFAGPLSAVDQHISNPDPPPLG